MPKNLIMQLSDIAGQSLSAQDVAAIQERLASQVSLQPLGPVRTIGGADAYYGGNFGCASVAVLDTDGELLARSFSDIHAVVPYLSGHLWFREGPLIAQAYERLTQKPDCLLLDGQGIMHPRFCGLACMVGLQLGIPTIGCAKTPIRSTWREPGPNRGDWSPVTIDGQTVGAVLRTQTGVKPVWVSPGHLCDLSDAIRVCLEMARFRIPEPLRVADQGARQHFVAGR